MKLLPMKDEPSVPLYNLMWDKLFCRKASLAK